MFGEFYLPFLSDLVLHSYGKEHEDILAALIVLFGLDIDTCESAGERDHYSLAAAGSDARMSGCEKPVCIISGSGNQGITASVPVAVYAEKTNATEEQTIRALALSHLTVIYIKQSLGRLSALCGCVEDLPRTESQRDRSRKG